MPYDKVQFIGHAVYTGTQRGDDGAFRYVGLRDDTEDMVQRLNLLSTVIEVAARHKSLAAGSDTLKVLVLPEFFFRGRAGAYALHAAIDTLVPGARRMLQHERWRDWFCCFGTLLGFHADATGTVVTSCCLLQRGGFGQDGRECEAGARAVWEVLPSRVDFITRERNPRRPLVMPDDHRGLLWDGPRQAGPRAHGTGPHRRAFDAFGLRWAVDICLDGREPAPPQPGVVSAPHIQLIPSCGAPVKRGSITVANGWLFNVDGLNTPSSELRAMPEGMAPAAACVRVPVFHPGSDQLFARGAGTVHLYEPVPALRS